MKNLLLLIFFTTLLIACSSESEEKGIEKTYVLKVVFTDNHEAEIRSISACPPKLSTSGCSSTAYLYIDCEHGAKIAIDVKYFSIVSEK